MCLYKTNIIIAISKASHAIDTRWRFLRWLTALHVNNNNNNNIVITFKPLPNIFLYLSNTEDKDAKFIFIFEFFKSTFERMNERFSQIISPSWKLKCRALRRILRRSMVINTLGDDSFFRMRAINPLIVKWELGVFYSK